MNAVMEGIVPKRYWTISQVAIKLSPPVSRVRFWCDFFKINTVRSKNNYRKFSPEDLEKITRICNLVEEGYHLKAILKKL